MKPISVDANVILRFLIGDPPDMALQARSLFEAVERREVMLWNDEIVLAEVVWVLHSFYQHGPERISPVLQELLNHEGIETEDKPGLLAALALFADRDIDFADALVAVHVDRLAYKRFSVLIGILITCRALSDGNQKRQNSCSPEPQIL